ncbi:MAG: hypothetical protein ACNA8W_26195 [Bradymonadaceae bacterium]
MKSRYYTTVGDDLDSDYLVGELVIDGQHFADVFEPPPYRVVIYPPPEGGAWKFPLELVQEALQAVKDRLDAMQPTPANDCVPKK